MVIAARRAYKDAVRWTVSARPPGEPQVSARRMLAALFVSAIVVLGIIGLSSPATFRASRSGWPWWVLLALVGGAAAALAFRWRTWTRPILGQSTWTEDEVDAAAGALESCPALYRIRYSLGWVWGPGVAIVMAAIFTFSSVYFLIDAVLARGDIGPEQALLCVGQLIVALVLLWIFSPRIRSVRFAHEAARRAIPG